MRLWKEGGNDLVINGVGATAPIETLHRRFVTHSNKFRKTAAFWGFLFLF